MSVDYASLPLGKPTAYGDSYNPELLMPVPRAQTRGDLPAELPFFGVDDWTGFELSWLNSQGKPQIGTVLLRYSAHSAAIVESKSLKLYLNGFNQTQIDSLAELSARIAADVGQTVGSDVQVHILSAVDSQQLAIKPWHDDCVDDLDCEISAYQIDAGLLKAGHAQAEQVLVSHLLRSNCPVTNQPDWASVRIHLRGGSLVPASLLAYICSFRQHQGFHEQCVERIYSDIWQLLQPEFLSVEGRFTRRGGIDINPFRASRAEAKPLGMRQLRQ